MPRKTKAKVKTKVAKTKDAVIPQSETTIVTKVRKTTTKAEELEFLGEWLAQEYLNIELNYNPLEEHHEVRNNKLQSCDGKDPNGRTVEVRTKKRNNRVFKNQWEIWLFTHRRYECANCSWQNWRKKISGYS